MLGTQDLLVGLVLAAFFFSAKRRGGLVPDRRRARIDVAEREAGRQRLRREPARWDVTIVSLSPTGTP